MSFSGHFCKNKVLPKKDMKDFFYSFEKFNYTTLEHSSSDETIIGSLKSSWKLKNFANTFPMICT